MRGQAATCLFESSRRAEATAFHARPSLKESNVALSFYEPLYTSVVLENNNYIIQGERTQMRDTEEKSPSSGTQHLLMAIVLLLGLVGHLTCMSPFLKSGLPRSAHRPTCVSSGSAQSVTPLSTTSAASGTLPAPFERGWGPVPGLGDSLEPSDDLFRLGRMLPVQGTSFENTLYGLGHV